MKWKVFLNNITSYFENNFWNIIGFISILVIGFFVVKMLLNTIKKLLEKIKMEKIAQQFLLTIFKFIFYLILTLVLLAKVGVQRTGILTTLSALLLAVGMALKNNISNVANGIIIVSTHMFKKGDYISLQQS